MRTEYGSEVARKEQLVAVAQGIVGQLVPPGRPNMPSVKHREQQLQMSCFTYAMQLHGGGGPGSAQHVTSDAKLFYDYLRPFMIEPD